MKATLLRKYLELYWLRPEVALWRLADADALHRVSFQGAELDLGCGNGLNSFILCGGQLPLSVDDFIDADTPDANRFLSGAADIYDSPPASIAKLDPPKHRIRLGLDWKQNLLDKAARLGLYERLMLHDANFPLPLDSCSVASAFSNTFYWIDNIDLALTELARTLRSDGVATVLVPDTTLRESFFYSKYVVGHGWDWMTVLDKGRHSHMRHFGTAAEWRQRFASSGLSVQTHLPYLSSRVHDIHEIGLRPISPVLVKMANRLSAADRDEIKREWVDYCMAVAEPLVNSGWLDDPALPTMFHAFVLRRS